MLPKTKADGGFPERDLEHEHEHVEDAKSAHVDTIHGDEAIKSMAGYAGEREWSPAEEKRLVRKIDRKLLPVMALSYGLQYYDKTLLSQAVCGPSRVQYSRYFENNRARVCHRQFLDSEKT